MRTDYHSDVLRKDESAYDREKRAYQETRTGEVGGIRPLVGSCALGAPPIVARTEEQQLLRQHCIEMALDFYRVRLNEPAPADDEVIRTAGKFLEFISR